MLLGCIYSTKAQTYFSCTHRSTYSINKALDGVSLINEFDENSLFEMNSRRTMIEHTCPNIQSAYYIQQESYDEEDEAYTFKVVSDASNEYIFIISFIDMNIKILGTDNDGDNFLVVFTIKKIWTN